MFCSLRRREKQATFFQAVGTAVEAASSLDASVLGDTLPGPSQF